jgi:DNA polymerase III subunit epsilon
MLAPSRKLAARSGEGQENRHVRWIRADIGVAVLIAAVGLLAVVAVMGTALDSASLRILAIALAGVAITSGFALAYLARRWSLRVEQLRGWVNLVAGESESLPREIAPDADAVDRVQLAIIDMLGMRIDQQGAIYRRLGDVLNAIPDGVVVVTPEGLISLVNAAGRPLFGSRDGVIGTSIYETLSRHSLANALALARDSEKPVSAVLHTVWSDALHATVARIGTDGSALLRFPATEAAAAALEHDLSLHDRPGQAAAVTPATPLSELPAVALDTETTGLDPNNDRVISIGAVRLHGARLYRSQTLNMLVNPGRSIPNRTIAIHGISNAMVSDAPLFDQIADRVLDYAGGLVLIGHHIDFDVAMLRSETQRCGRDWRPAASLDVMLLYVGLFPDRHALRLDDIAAVLDVPVIGRHSALGDALTTGEIFVRLIDAMSAQGIDTLEAAQALQHKAARQLGIGTAARPVPTP